MRTTGRTADSDSGPPAFPNRAHRLPPGKGLEAVSSLAVGEGADGGGGGGGGGIIFYILHTRERKKMSLIFLADAKRTPVQGVRVSPQFVPVATSGPSIHYP